MEFRVYPIPTGGYQTPFVTVAPNTFARLAVIDGGVRSLAVRRRGTSVCVSGCYRAAVIGNRVPSHSEVRLWLRTHLGVNSEFVDFAQNTIVVPTFPMSCEEAYVKTVLRQVIAARQAKILFARFVSRFGHTDGVRWGFPCRDAVARITVEELCSIGLRFRASVIVEGLARLSAHGPRNIGDLPGIGEWSARVLGVELDRDYVKYPFDDLSGHRVSQLLGRALIDVAAESPTLAADLYIYGVAYIEDMTCKQKCM